jgi:hypothetical protein
MRYLFWGLFIVGLAGSVLGVGVFEPVLDVNADIDVLVAWWLAWAVYGAILGAIVGMLAGVAARYMVKHVPSEPAADFLNRVRWWGLSGQTVAALVASVVAAFFAAAYAGLEALSSAERVHALVLGLNFAAVPGTALLSASLFFAVVTASLDWGGRYAVVTPRLFFIRRVAKG